MCSMKALFTHPACCTVAEAASCFLVRCCVLFIGRHVKKGEGRGYKMSTLISAARVFLEADIKRKPFQEVQHWILERCAIRTFAKT